MRSAFFVRIFMRTVGVRLLEEMWLLLGNTMNLLNSNSVGLKKNIHDIHIRTLQWDIRKYH
ncbi:hypothetical protein SSIL_1473 [Solibacillus silvestris StLB046]|uniref:Uncharacterized protein n=1 Tax=Solibacillus silvestris (strain StLB046) TaxID=1002809 RepID=F2F3E8_SOLSS|nr:hypothetical protein SSIL_1473 [Solibacillus silvestris StLB046]